MGHRGKQMDYEQTKNMVFYSNSNNYFWFYLLIFNGLNYGIDFAGGTIIHIDLHRTLRLKILKNNRFI